MPLNIRNKDVNRLAEQLASSTGRRETEAVTAEPQNEMTRLDQTAPLRERVRPLQDRMLSGPATGLEADKAFYDELSDDL